MFTAEGEPRVELERLLSEDDTLARILGTTWRPDFFRKMINDGRIDLALVPRGRGALPRSRRRSFRLVLTRETLEFPYQRIERSGTTTYAAVGTDLRITVLDEERISVSYRDGDQQAGGLYAIARGGRGRGDRRASCSGGRTSSTGCGPRAPR